MENSQLGAAPEPKRLTVNFIYLTDAALIIRPAYQMILNDDSCRARFIGPNDPSGVQCAAFYGGKR